MMLINEETESLCNLDSMIIRLLSLDPLAKNNCILTIKEIEGILERSKDILMSEPILLRLDTPQVIIGTYIFLSRLRMV